MLTIIFLLQVLFLLQEIRHVGAFVQHDTMSSFREQRTHYYLKKQTSSLNALPKAIIFDLDGCLWRPEMYELVWFSNGKGSPFRQDPKNPENLLTRGNEPVYLLGDVREVLSEIYNDERYKGVKIGISSRTDEPDWARELLSKFTLKSVDSEKAAIEEVFTGPIEIAKDSKVEHFKRISNKCNIEMEDILFFDNELGNCRQVARLGVTVSYCPDGITFELWNRVLNEGFPTTDGTVFE